MRSLFPASGENFKTDARDHFLMYCLGTKNMSIDQITALSPEDKRVLGEEFLRQVWEHPVFGQMAGERRTIRRIPNMRRARLRVRMCTDPQPDNTSSKKPTKNLAASCCEVFFRRQPDLNR